MITRRVRDRGHRVAFGGVLYEDAGVISLFGRDGGGLEYLDERRRSEYVAHLAGSADEVGWSSAAVGHHLDLGDQSFA